MLLQHCLTFLYGVIGGYVFSIIHIPLPWTLGPLTSMMMLQSRFKRPIMWPSQARDIAFIFLSYVMGSSFTPETGINIVRQFPLLFAAAVTSVIVCIVSGYFASKFTGISAATSVMGSLPGGMSQMATISEEIKEADPTAVALMQTSRVLIVIFCVPFIAMHGLAEEIDLAARANTLTAYGDLSTYALFFGFNMMLVYLAGYTKIAGRYVVPPILGTAALTLAGFTPPPLPSWLINVAQICVGLKIGSTVNVNDAKKFKKLLTVNVISLAAALVMLFVLDHILVVSAPMSLLTAFISTSPGGMSEMGLVAMVTHADLSTVVAFQLSRLLFVLIIATPLVKWWLVRAAGRY